MNCSNNLLPNVVSACIRIGGISWSMDKGVIYFIYPRLSCIQLTFINSLSIVLFTRGEISRRETPKDFERNGNNTIYLRNYNKRSHLSIVRCYFCYTLNVFGLWKSWLIAVNETVAIALRYTAGWLCMIAFLSIWFISLFQTFNIIHVNRKREKLFEPQNPSIRLNVKLKHWIAL